MKVHLRSLVGTSIEHGVVESFYRFDPTKEHDKSEIIDVILSNIWKRLDEVVDFREENDNMKPKRIGFETVPAVAEKAPLEEVLDPNVEEQRRNSLTRRYRLG